MMEGRTGVPGLSAPQKREVVQRVGRGEALEAVQEVERWLQLNLLTSLAEVR